jgi:hypothetical protein
MTKLRLPRLSRGKALLGGALAAGLAAAGIAIAGPGAGPTTAVSGSLGTLTATDVHTRTCTASNGDVIQTTHAKYTGTSSGNSDARFNGSVSADVKSVIDTTTKLGSLDGHVQVDGSAGPGEELHGGFRAVYNNGSFEGLLKGDVSNPDGKLLADVSGSFTAGTSTTLALGSGTATNWAIVSSGHCEPAGPEGPEHVTSTTTTTHDGQDRPKPDQPKHD